MSAKGFGCAAVAVFAFGSNFVPVKQYDTADGMFFQWVMCCSIFFVGIIVQFARDAYIFEPFAAVGGILWCTGNTLAVPVIKCIGMGVGLLLWGTANLVVGWATGAFGLFGLDKNTVNVPGLNYTGFAIALSSIGIFFFVKTETSNDAKLPSALDPAQIIDPTAEYTAHVQKRKDEVALEAHALFTADSAMLSEPLAGTNSSGGGANSSAKSIFDKLGEGQKRILGFTLAIIAGLFFGTNFDPPQYLIDTSKRGVEAFGRLHSTEAMDYVFSHFTGIFFASTFYFLVYCAYMRNRPIINHQLILPSFVSGALWAIAQVCFFVANEELEFVVSFPIICTGPGVVAALWGILLFKEVKGRKNVTILITACVVTTIGVLLIALSRVL